MAEISSYLDGLRTAQGQFTQVNEDGSISTGRILLKRPGRVRFEYDPPDEALVVADGDTLGIVDPRSNERQGYPLHRTPLKIILARNVDLTRERMVVGHASDGKTTTVRAQDPDNPEYGSIDLVFTADPIELRQWVIHDGNGTSTTVILGDLQTGCPARQRQVRHPRQGACADRPLIPRGCRQTRPRPARHAASCAL